ncbi:DCP2, partial [Symbiodinium pilosum]
EALQQCAARVEAKAPKHPDALCLSLQEAYWSYLDETVDAAKGHFPHLQPSAFVELLLEVSEALSSHGTEIAQCFRDWRQKRLAQPRCGAVILDESLEKCLMVQAHSSNLWFFPSGKLEENETEVQGAIREVWEEIGLDITHRVDERQYLKAIVPDNGRAIPVKLFVLVGLPEKAELKPQAKKEITAISWVRNSKLPGWESGSQTSKTMRFLNMEHFAPQLRRLVNEMREGIPREKALAGGWLDMR